MPVLFYIDGLYASCVYGFCCGDSGRLCQYHKYRFHTDGTIGNMTGGETNGNEQVLTFFFLWDDGTIGYGVGEPTADFYISFIFYYVLTIFFTSNRWQLCESMVYAAIPIPSVTVSRPSQCACVIT